MSTFRPEYCSTALMMCRMGATDIQLAAALDASLLDIKAWQTKYPQFGEACRVGGEQAIAQVERALFSRAMGYDYDSVRFDNIDKELIETPISVHVPPDVNAQKYFLENMAPEKWSSKTKAEITGKDGKPLMPDNVVEFDLDAMEDEDVKGLLAFAKSKNSDD